MPKLFQRLSAARWTRAIFAVAAIVLLVGAGVLVPAQPAQAAVESVKVKFNITAYDCAGDPIPKPNSVFYEGVACGVYDASNGWAFLSSGYADANGYVEVTVNIECSHDIGVKVVDVNRGYLALTSEPVIYVTGELPRVASAYASVNMFYCLDIDSVGFLPNRRPPTPCQ
jgi:hypothetical protein